MWIKYNFLDICSEQNVCYEDCADSAIECLFVTFKYDKYVILRQQSRTGFKRVKVTGPNSEPLLKKIRSMEMGP